MTGPGDAPRGLDDLRRLAIRVFLGLVVLIVVAAVAGRSISDGLAGLVVGGLITFLGLGAIASAVKK